MPEESEQEITCQDGGKGEDGKQVIRAPRARKGEEEEDSEKAQERLSDACLPVSSAPEVIQEGGRDEEGPRGGKVEYAVEIDIEGRFVVKGVEESDDIFSPDHLDGLPG